MTDLKDWKIYFAGVAGTAATIQLLVAVWFFGTDLLLLGWILVGFYIPTITTAAILWRKVFWP